MTSTNSPEVFQRFVNIIWHPHQGLWNWTLVRRLYRHLPEGGAHRMQTLIVYVDSLILWCRAILRRISTGGLKASLLSPRTPSGVKLVYLDLGLHREAAELRWMLDAGLPELSDSWAAYGFEASGEFLSEAHTALGDRAGLTLIHAALCREVPDGGTLRLYISGNQGLGSSVLQGDTDSAYEDVPALRFSDWLSGSGFDPEHTIIFLRMNIEGSEFDVMADLIQQGLSDQVDGYFGMWDDVHKVDPEKDRAFRKALAVHHIKPLTFNGRDLPYRFRMNCIRYDMGTALLNGIRRIEAGRTLA